MASEANTLSETQTVRDVTAPRRLAAWLIDHFIIAPLVIMLTVAWFELYSFAPTLWYEISRGLMLAYVVVILYMTIGIWLFGASIGKEIMGLRVVTVDGKRVGLGKTLLREVVGKFLCQATLFVGFAATLWRPDNRGLHETISGTKVICRRD